MAIKSIDILNVLVFQAQLCKNNKECSKEILKDTDIINSGFHLNFSDGVNVLTGENGVGKTSILKMIYAATQLSAGQGSPRRTKYFLQFFSNNTIDTNELKNNYHKNDYCYYKVSDGCHNFECSLSHNGISGFDEWTGLGMQAVFIPAMEMLSHSKGFLAMHEKYNMPFDGTQADIIMNASLPETRKIPINMSVILDKISDVIDGIVLYENDNFYIIKRDGHKIDFTLEAEGFRKLGLLWKLIRNGLLEKDSILLWDEPEANLNPELYPLVADVLLELQENGVQIFAATQSYNFAKYLEIRRKEKEHVIFHNLYKSSSGNGGIICSQSAYKMEELEPNHST